MSVYKRKSGRYTVVVPAARGSRKRVSLGTYRTRKEADHEEREALRKLEDGVSIAPEKITVGEILALYIERCYARNLAPSTIERYEDLARLHIAPTLGRQAISELRESHVTELYGAIRKKGRAIKTVRHVASLLNASIEWAMRKKLCSRNVAALAHDDLPQLPKSAARSLSLSEIERLLEVANKTPWRALFTFHLCTGARRGELAALRWSNVDEANAIVSIVESLSATKRGVAIKQTKTNRMRAVPLSTMALQALRSQRALQAEERLRAGPAYENHDLVFAGPLGKRWHPRSITNAFARIAEQAGIEAVRLHDIRHSTATWLLQSGVDVRTVAAILGHSSATTTLATYAHVMPGAEAAAVEKIAKRFAK